MLARAARRDRRGRRGRAASAGACVRLAADRAAVRAPDRARQPARRARRPDRDRAARHRAGARRGSTSPPRRPRTAACSRCARWSIVGCFALHSAAVDPDDLLRAFRRISFRSALTAALATRLVPVLARDARRLHDAQRCLAGEPAPRRAIVRAVASGALDRAVDVAATLEVRGYGAARRPPRRRRRGRGRATTSRSPRARVALAAVALAAHVAGAQDVRRVPGVQRAGRARAQLGLCAVLAVCALLPFADRRGIGPMSAALRLDARHLPLPGRARRRRCATSTSTSRPASSSCSRAARGSGKSTLLRAAVRARPALPRRRVRRPAGVRRARHAHARARPRSPRSPGTLFQDPETQVVMGTVRAELAFPLENRGLGAAAVARGVEEAALALGIAPLLDRSTHELSGGELQRVALGAALAGRPRVALLDEPTSQLDPVAGDELLGVLRRLNEEWGTAVDPRRAPARALPERRRPRRRAARRRGRLRRRPARLPRLGGRARAGAADAGRAAVRARRPRRRRPCRSRTRAARSAPTAATAADRSSRATATPAPPARPRGAAATRAEPALALSRRLVRAQRRRGGAARRRPRGRAGRARRADGPQRRRASRRCCASPPGCWRRRAGRCAAGASRCCCSTPATTRCATASATSCPPDALAAAGLAHLAERHPRDLSGGERQRLALAIVLHGERPAVVCLDEPTRGMDRAPQGRARGAARGPRRAGQRGGRRHARRRVRRRVRDPHGAARRRPAGRRRADRRGAGRRLVLRDRRPPGSWAARRCCRRRAPRCCGAQEVGGARELGARLVPAPRRSR